MKKINLDFEYFALEGDEHDDEVPNNVTILFDDNLIERIRLLMQLAKKEDVSIQLPYYHTKYFRDKKAMDDVWREGDEYFLISPHDDKFEFVCVNKYSRASILTTEVHTLDVFSEPKIFSQCRQ